MRLSREDDHAIDKPDRLAREWLSGRHDPVHSIRTDYLPREHCVIKGRDARIGVLDTGDDRAYTAFIVVAAERTD